MKKYNSMKHLIKTSIFIFAFAVFNSCSVQVPLSTAPPKNNATYNVEYLFEHDGCKVYRFRDQGHYVYFTNCKGDVTSIESNDSTEIHIINHIK